MLTFCSFFVLEKQHFSDFSAFRFYFAPVPEHLPLKSIFWKFLVAFVNPIVEVKSDAKFLNELIVFLIQMDSFQDETGSWLNMFFNDSDWK